MQSQNPDNGRIVRANGVDLCAEVLGDPGDPAILLIHGATGSMLAWDDEFFQQLAAGPRYVVRYDHRDTGRSVSYPPGAPGYGFDDLVADALGLIDAFGLERAHLVGTSMGGGIAMSLALDHPERVASLTLIASSPGGQDLPSVSAEFLDMITRPEQPDWSNREAMIDYSIEFLRICTGSSEQLDEVAVRANLGRDYDRTTNIASSQINHFALEMEEPLRNRLGEMRVPTLVIHGAEDPVFPLGHGEALASEIPVARLIILDNAGHVMTRGFWERALPPILDHTARNRAAAARG